MAHCNSLHASRCCCCRDLLDALLTRRALCRLFAETQPPALTDFDAEAGLLALQKHVDAASHTSITNITANSDQSVAPTSDSALAQTHLYAAALSQPTTSAAYPDLEAQIHPDLRSAQQLGHHLGGSSFPALSTTLNSSIMSTVPPQAAPTAIPAPVGSPIPMQTDGQPAADGRRGPRRELSQSKRAAQNRAAQVCGRVACCYLPICSLHNGG